MKRKKTGLTNHQKRLKKKKDDDFKKHIGLFREEFNIKKMSDRMLYKEHDARAAGRKCYFKDVSSAIPFMVFANEIDERGWNE